MAPGILVVAWTCWPIWSMKVVFEKEGPRIKTEHGRRNIRSGYLRVSLLTFAHVHDHHPQPLFPRKGASSQAFGWGLSAIKVGL